MLDTYVVWVTWMSNSILDGDNSNCEIDKKWHVFDFNYMLIHFWTIGTWVKIVCNIISDAKKVDYNAIAAESTHQIM